MEGTALQELIDTYIVIRYLYRIGKSPFSDEEYDSLHTQMIEAGAVPEFTSRSHDDDPIPVDLLHRFGYGAEESQKVEDIPGSEHLIEDKSFSIKALKNLEELWAWYNKFSEYQKIISVKLDGNNVKALVGDSNFTLALTRGRSSNGFNVTEAMQRVYPEGGKLPVGSIIRGECFVDPNMLEEIREYYGKDSYKTPKSAAISLLRRPSDHLPVHYKALQYVVFSCDGLARTVSETYDKLSSCGFKVPPYETVGESFDSFDSFAKWINPVFDRMWQKQQDLGIPSDGLVIELNDIDLEAEITGQYDEKQVAVKFGHWSPRVYRGIITSIHLEQRRVFCSCRVGIEPVTTGDGCEATTINSFNPSFLIDLDLTIGSEIEFERNSGAVNIMINGKKIKLDGAEKE